jgi:tyrosyl-tRNA synthetase
MTLSEELTWRGFVNQTTIKDITLIDADPITFYFGVDPSAASMQIGNLAAAMMVKHFMKHGHEGVLLVGGATGMIGDPDGKAEERSLKSLEEVQHNKDAIAAQYRKVFDGMDFVPVDNYDWFKDMNYLSFLRDVGKHVPMRQMLGRDFIQTRLGEEGAGISYAEFSYVLIQAYDFLHLQREHGVSLQVCGSDQWGNSIAGVELIRRIDNKEAHVWSVPLIINKATGQKFGKSEAGTVWLDPALTTPTEFYQFWINADDAGVEDYLKVFTELDKETIDELMSGHRQQPQKRLAQQRLAQEVTKLVHGSEAVTFAETVTRYLTGEKMLNEADEVILAEIRRQLPAVQAKTDSSLTTLVAEAGLASSTSDARRLLAAGALYINGEVAHADGIPHPAFQNGRVMIRKGKKYKDSALIELAD